MAEAAMNSEVKPKKKFPFWVLILIGLIALNFYVAGLYKPLKPEIEVGAESILFDVVDGEIVSRPWFTLPKLGPVYLTNSLLSHIVSYICLAILVIVVQKETKEDTLLPHGVSGLIEMVMELLGGMAESSVKEEYRKTIFPAYYSIFLGVLITNLSKLLPFFENIGIAALVNEGNIADRWGKLIAITGEAAPEGEMGWKLIGFFRCGPSDLNCTLGIACFAVLMIQILGLKIKGVGYLNRFINIRALIHNKQTGVVDFMVGILELVAEFAKIASFGFRLFGNMFAGMVLLAFIGYIIPWGVGSVMMLYELFIGVLQAFLFGMLTAVFTGMAVNE